MPQALMGGKRSQLRLAARRIPLCGKPLCSAGESMTMATRLQRASIGCCGLMLAIMARAEASASACMLAPQGEGRVEAIIDARSFRMQDGREVRLAGIEPVATRRDTAIATLTGVLLDREVTLHGDSDAPDRYGRQPAFVFLAESATSVQELLLSEGEALVAAETGAAPCRTALLAAEANARRARRSVWAEPAAIKNAENSGDILAAMGQFALVEGKVVSVREAGTTVYLNFGRRWTRDFAVTISRRVGAAFEAAGIALKSLENKRIRVRGWVEQRGGPRIEIRQIGQIERLGDN
jgi:endonuclease YncB( thermonuclease family)